MYFLTTGAEVEEDDAGEMVSILVVEEDDEAKNRENYSKTKLVKKNLAWR